MYPRRYLLISKGVLRPQYQTELTIHDRTPSLFLADLINLYSTVFPPLIEKKKVESDRIMPVRKRTVLVDQRISRSRLGAETDPRELLEQQHAMQNPPRIISPLPTMSRMASASSLGFGIPLQNEPQREPEEKEDSNLTVTPPTPQPSAGDRGKVPDPLVPSLPEDEPFTSPTASILESMEISNTSGDADAPVATGATALKRATSAEVTRLRGPRG